MSILACKIILVELALPCLAGLASITESHLADLISRSQQRVVGCQETAKKNRWGCDCQGHFVFFEFRLGFLTVGIFSHPFLLPLLVGMFYVQRWCGTVMVLKVSELLTGLIERSFDI